MSAAKLEIKCVLCGVTTPDIGVQSTVSICWTDYEIILKNAYDRNQIELILSNPKLYHEEMAKMAEIIKKVSYVESENDIDTMKESELP